ncbi:MAG: DnaJ domain-containing protein [Bacteroidales bacterium]|nr:DnaJ domain-containing protein [Bacteroidales bacterium]
MLNYYEILNINQNAGLDEIKRAYRLLAKKIHPDLNKSTDAKLAFQILNEAYHTLIDLHKRNEYDLYLKNDLFLYRKYGKSYKDRQAKQSNTDYSYYKYYTSGSNTIKKSNIFNKYLNNFLFIIMLVIGIITIIFGIIDLIYKKWEGLRNLQGILFGLSFTGFLIYGWYLLIKTPEKDRKTDIF